RGLLHHNQLSPFKQALVSHAYAYTPCICLQLIHLSQPVHLAQPPLLLPSLTPPRICVASYTYAWLHPDHSTNIPTHMRYFQRICVANSPSTPFNPLPVYYSHAYAYNTTHMRGTHIQNLISYFNPRLGVLAYA
ncbi:hypothetical protein PIB30_107645, partial [Stylosanthes scabra]|nr:hypothetical protein [Stylosanthes scabra]